MGKKSAAKRLLCIQATNFEYCNKGGLTSLIWQGKSGHIVRRYIHLLETLCLAAGCIAFHELSADDSYFNARAYPGLESLSWTAVNLGQPNPCQDCLNANTQGRYCLFLSFNLLALLHSIRCYQPRKRLHDARNG